MIIETYVSDKAIEVLKRLKVAKYAEFRDRESSLEEFLKSDLHLVHGKTEEYFKARNFCDYDDIAELIDSNLVDDGDGMSWHTTYYVSELGEELLKKIESGEQGYWKQRCEAAEKIISHQSLPLNDKTAPLYEAWEKLKDKQDERK